MLQKVSYSWQVKLIIFLFAIVMVNGMTWLITSINQKAGLYPADADSIGIPIMYTAGASLLMLLVLIIMSLLSKKFSLIWRESKGIAWTIIIRIPLFLGYVTAFLLAIYGAVYWSYPGHYPIAASYLILCGIFLTGLLFDLRNI